MGWRNGVIGVEDVRISVESKTLYEHKTSKLRRGGEPRPSAGAEADSGPAGMRR